MVTRCVHIFFCFVAKINTMRGVMRRSFPRYASSFKKHFSDISTPARSTVLDENKKELKTALAGLLQNRIHVGGFLPFSEFFKECLMNPEYGYYTTKRTVIGGASADFTTAAEIPIFCDIICGWIVDVWNKMGTPRRVNLVELGPGKGSLMCSVLRQMQTISPALFQFVNVHMVEAGTQRMEEQKVKLKDFQTATQKIQWYLDIDSLSVTGTPTIMIANEFFDALPVTQFTKDPQRGWLEAVVDVDEDPSQELHFKLAQAPANSFANLLIPDDVPKDMTQIEINTYGMATMEKVGRKLIDSGMGACLIIDYGKDEYMSDTVRGIRGHKFVNPLLSPGDVDLSAWVSFKQLRWALSRWSMAREQLRSYGPLTQRSFLEQNGIDVRLLMLCKAAETKIGLNIISNWRRLMEDKMTSDDSQGMGKNFKVWCVATANLPPPSPWLKK